MLLTVENWPRPVDAERARLGLERLRERADQAPGSALGEFVQSLTEDGNGRAMLEAVFGHSPYLTECILAEIGFLQRLIEDGPDACLMAVLEEIDTDLDAESDTARLMSGLRVAKRRCALLIALSDIAGLWSFDLVTGALSWLAEASLRVAVRHLLRQAAQRGVLTLEDADQPDAGSGLIILAMGKLGAGELNYSSDVDLIVLYDDARVRVRRPDEMTRTFVRLTRDLVRIMEERTADGYVFRTDLRLRPDPGATPMAVSVTASESYYGSMALNWERAAMIRARPVAGDIQAGHDFLQSISPFIWRRALDFAAVQDIHSIKRRIHDARGHEVITINGHNLKLGRGGIREIEFFTQAQQLIFGGRDPRFRTSRTIDTLAVLAETGRADRAVTDALAADYRFLRRVEHRLQMVDDQQTHSLPEQDEPLDRLAVFLGFTRPKEFRDALGAALRRVERQYDALFQGAPQPPSGAATMVFAGADLDPDTLQALADLGFSKPEAVVDTVRGWLHGRYRATRSERTRGMLTQLAPTILDALARTGDPDGTLHRFDTFLQRLPAGIQLFALFHSNPHLVPLMARILGTSGRLADYLARNPAQFDCVLMPGFLDSLPDRRQLADELALMMSAAPDYEDGLNVLRRFTNDNRFRIGVQMLRGGEGDGTHAGFLSDVAEAALAALIPRVEAEFARRHGGFANGAMAIIAMGKLGGRELSIRSDLDLIMVYDVPDGDTQSDGDKPLAPTTYYARLIQRLLSAITAPTAEGSLYEVDMRLRPSGRSGPLATSLEAFTRYQDESAWTWEHMALTRARAISSDDRLCTAVEGVIRDVLCRPRDADTLLRDVADMRARIDKEHGTEDIWTVKYLRGGLIDIEFIAQYLQLLHAHAAPEVLSPNTAEALGRLADAGVLSADSAETLISTLALWQRIQAYLRLTVEGAFNPAEASEALLAGLGRAAFPDETGDLALAALEQRLRASAAKCHGLFAEIVEEPAARLPKKEQ